MENAGWGGVLVLFCVAACVFAVIFVRRSGSVGSSGGGGEGGGGCGW